MNVVRIVTVIGNTSATSRTRVLAEGIDAAVSHALAGRRSVEWQNLQIAELAPHIGNAVSPAGVTAAGAAALRAIESADLVIAVTPVYKGSYTGLFKHLFDLVAPDALVGRPALLAANGGSERHALVVDHQLRPLFGFFRALTVPSAVYAAESDFDGHVIRSPALQQRIDEAAQQAAELLLARTAALPERLAA